MSKKGNFTNGDSSGGDALTTVDEMSYDSTEALTALSSNNNDTWVFDSWCTFHMAPYKEKFVDYKEMNDGITKTWKITINVMYWKFGW